MTVFELLAYVLIVFMVFCLIVSIGVSIMMVVNRRKAIEEFKSNREKGKHKIDL